ncbi:MAG TPA: PepSY-associated TM helix domain-containing protein [Candidatus Acidoferrales bacterium]|nr:PepSY-associated TM helix domain-containing protein [Candidatus Acidoferrales bacterium]
MRKKPILKARFASFARWLHTYLSMFAFLILFFFAVTGFTLNHAQWFDSQQKVAQRDGTLDSSWLRGTVNQAAIAQYFRKQGIKGTPEDFNADDSQCELSFKGPGYEADVNINRATGKYQLTETRAGFVGVLNDLHKGRDTGAKWSAVIDITAIGMTLVSLTGITLIFFLTKRRMYGLMSVVIGAAICFIAYLLFVP